MSYTLVIGTKNWSSWSLRPWLLMRVAEIPFAEIEIPLREPGTAAAIAPHSPSGKVPVLKCAGGPVIWDSLAIAEFLAERHPECVLWPPSAAARAEARAVVAEMHSGFQALRQEMPMDCLARHAAAPRSAEAERDITRIRTLWRRARDAYGSDGPFLFGRFSVADAFYAPVVSRFVTHSVALDGAERAYADTIWALPPLQAWLDGCAAWAARHGAGT